MKDAKDTLSPKEETIQTLLAWYVDVLEGWSELGRGADGFGVKMMSRAWNTRTYQELNRCLLALRDEDNRTYWHVRETYLAGSRRTVLACPHPGCNESCEVAAKWFDERGNVSRKHKHGDTVFWVRKTVPVVNAAVNPEAVTRGVKWLAERFVGEPYVPDELRPKERAA